MRKRAVKILLKSIVALVSAVPHGASAIEQTSVLNRLILVGVISHSSADPKSSVVVVKDKASNRSILMRLGDKISQSEPWVLKEITRQGVTFSDGAQLIELEVGDNAEEVEKPVVPEPRVIVYEEESLDGRGGETKVDYRSEAIRASRERAAEAYDERNFRDNAAENADDTSYGEADPRDALLDYERPIRHMRPIKRRALVEELDEELE